MSGRIISAETFVPHTLHHLTAAHVFPNPLPEVAYNQMLVEYEELTNVSVSRIVYDSDGIKVTGLMALPAYLRPGSHPVIIYNRGGSREYGKLTLLSVMRSMVPFAKEGYIVFASNYRGNDGGEGQEQFGGSDVDDVMNLLTIAVADKLFDGKNAYMIGHSRGGMMTTMAIRRGAKLSAAVSIAGIADAHVLAKDPAMVERVLKPLVPGYEKYKYQVLSERSSVDWAKEITVPLLLLHGDKDQDVKVLDSILLDRAMREAGRQSQLHIFSQSNHALTRVWDEVIERSLDWMRKHKT